MSPSYLFIEQVVLILIGFATFVLGFWVYASDRKKKLNQVFFLMTIFISIWPACGFLTELFAHPLSSLFWARLGYAVVSLFIITYYFFINLFPRKEKSFPLLDKIVIIVGAFFFFIALLTDLVIKEITFKAWGVDFIFGQGALFYFSFVIFFPFLALYLLLRKYFNLSPVEKIRVQYFLIGFFIFSFANVIFNIILPVWRGSVQYYLFGNYSSIFLVGLTAFAIVKRELFGVKVILTQILVMAVAILLLAQAVTVTNWLSLEFAWKFGLFLLFLFFGYLLIQSVIREIQRRAELQRLYEKVDKLSRAKSEFISIASHQLRTPLTAIKGYISMLLEGTYGKFGEKAEPPLEKVYQSNERLIKLVNDLLNVSRIESGELGVDFQEGNIEEIIPSVLDELKIKADEKKLYLKWQKPAKPLPKLTIDVDKIRQVILNIVDNCIKYTEKGGVTVSTELRDPSAKWPQGKILIAIKDTGVGMSKEEIEKMFESFSRGRAGARFWSAGLGLGLYIAKKFTELHNGKIWAESEGEGKGSTFFIELPIK